MQPPPVRKGPYLKTLKHVHTEQVARLQAKNQHECDLLEDIRNFTKQRSVIEKTYAEALLKVSSAYLNKKIPSIPDLRDEEEDEKWNVWNVWRTVLEENEKLARARLAAVEVFQQQITDDAKTIRQAKLQASKKCLDQLSTVQKEVQISVSELDRNKKLYFEEEHLAHDARVKATDAEEKLKKKKGSIFSSFTSLQSRSAKFSTKKEACEEKSTGARNEYIMALAQANAHQDRYFLQDMDNCLRTLEGDVYDKLKEYLTVIGRTELLTCSAAQNSFSKIRDQAQMLSRDYNVMCCVQYYPVLKQHIRYPFDACDGDHCRKITSEHISMAALSREAKNWATKISKQVKIIRENQRKCRILMELKEAGHKSDPDDPNGPDLDTKLDEVKENIRKAETEKLKAESVIECFRDGGVNVDEWMKDVETLAAALDIPRSGSSASLKTDASSGQEPQNRAEVFYDSDSHETLSFEKVGKEKPSQPQPVPDSPEPREVNIDARVEQERKRLESLTWDDPMKVDWGDDGSHATAASVQEPVFSPPPDSTNQFGGRRDSWPHDSSTEPGITKCVALYSYAAQNPDELSILENEHLDLIGEGDGDGWVRARNYKGEEGYVPQNYVELEGNTSAAGYPLQPQISFSSVDYHVQDTSGATEDDHTTMEDYSSVAPPATQANGISNGYPEPTETEDYYNQNITEEIPVTTAPTTVSSGLTTPFINECRGEDGSFCRALYDYEAAGPEELSFYAGQIIRIIRFNPHDDGEDGWWEGEYDGLRGIFPSIVADECRWDGEPLSPDGMDMDEEDDEISDSGICPPAYTPPEAPPVSLLPPDKVIITQPTPVTENAATTIPPTTEDKAAPKPTNASKGSSYAYDKTNFEMELNSDQQQKYQAQFDEEGEPIVVAPEVPDVQIMVTEPDEPREPRRPEPEESGDAGLEVTQIVITAATPMSEEHKTFAGGIVEEEEQEEETPTPPNEEETKPEPEIEAFADFSQIEDTMIPEEPVVQEVEDTKTIEEAAEEEALPPPPPPPSTSEELEEADRKEILRAQFTAASLQSALEPKKASLEIDDNEARFLRGESGESPVTPEELELHNLAKLESLKESDA